MAFGLLVSEFPLQTLVAQGGALALASRRLSRQARRRAWLLSALMWLGLLGLKRAGREAEAALSAALKADLDTMPPIEPEQLWRRPPPHGATAKTRGRCGCCASIVTTPTDPTSAMARTVPLICSTSGAAPTWIRANERRCCCRCPAERGQAGTNAARHIR